jgi:hypothetical protein
MRENGRMRIGTRAATTTRASDTIRVSEVSCMRENGRMRIGTRAATTTRASDTIRVSEVSCMRENGRQASPDTCVRSACLLDVLQELKLPWKRYICFSHDGALLGPDIKPSEFTADDGVRAVRVSSWAAWAARKKMAPAAAKVSAAHEAFLSDLHGKLIAEMEPHAYSKTVARVRCGRELSSEEQQFNAMRGRVVKKGIQALTGVD